MKDTNWIPGEWKAVCDICGFDFLASQLLENWKGQRVCSKDFETRHPQEFVRQREETIAVPWMRPSEDDDVAILTGNQAPAATLNFTIYTIDSGAGSTFTLPAANSATYLGIETRIQINNVGTGAITVSSASSIKASAQLTSSLTSIAAGGTHTYRCIPSQNYWYREA
jgi:hypothetical protein